MKFKVGDIVVVKEFDTEGKEILPTQIVGQTGIILKILSDEILYPIRIPLNIEGKQTPNYTEFGFFAKEIRKANKIEEQKFLEKQI